MDRKITPRVLVWEKSARPDGTFSRADFVFEQERNIYVCPGDVLLTSTGNVDEGNIVYASQSDSARCAEQYCFSLDCQAKVSRRSKGGPTSDASVQAKAKNCAFDHIPSVGPE